MNLVTKKEFKKKFDRLKYWRRESKRNNRR